MMGCYWTEEDVLASETIYGSEIGDSNFKGKYDINKNGEIDSYDLQWIQVAADEHRMKASCNQPFIWIAVIGLLILLAVVFGGRR